MKTPRNNINERIKDAFTEYQSTIDLIRELIRNKKHINEIIILVCARLDSLANVACQKKTQKENFFNFITCYSNHSDLLNIVSLPDLYNYFEIRLWQLPGMIEKPGRLHLFDTDDKPLGSFIWKSELPITEKDIELLLSFVLRVLRSKYRVMPGQSKKKKEFQSLPELHKQLLDAAASYKTQKYVKAIEAIEPILKDHMVGNLLYTDYRCAVIHEYGFEIDPTLFFKATTPYYAIFSNDWAGYRQFRLHFPAAFLLSLIKDCIEKYQTKLFHTQKLPSSIYFKICESGEDLKYLDENTIGEGIDAQLKI